MAKPTEIKMAPTNVTAFGFFLSQTMPQHGAEKPEIKLRVLLFFEKYFQNIIFYHKLRH